jgi:rhodanese-related sulfurtransferase
MDDLTIEPRQVSEMLKSGEKFVLLDCREPWEYQTARIEGATLIPMQQIPNRRSHVQTKDVSQAHVNKLPQSKRSLARERSGI